MDFVHLDIRSNPQRWDRFVELHKKKSCPYGIKLCHMYTSNWDPQIIVDLWRCSIPEEGATLWNKSKPFVHVELRSTDMVDLWSCARRKCDFVEQIYANLFILELRSTDGVDLWSCTRRKCDFVEQIYAIRTFGTEIHRCGRFVELYKKKVRLCGTNLCNSDIWNWDPQIW